MSLSWLFRGGVIMASKYWIAYTGTEAAVTMVYGVLKDDSKLTITDQNPKYGGPHNPVIDLGFTPDEHGAITNQQLVRILDNPVLTATDDTNLGKLQLAGGLSPSLLTGIIEGFRQQLPNEVMGLFSNAQIEYTYANHPAFKSKQTQI